MKIREKVGDEKLGQRADYLTFAAEFWNDQIFQQRPHLGEMEERKQQQQNGGQLRQKRGIHEEACSFKHVHCAACLPQLSLS